MEYRLIALVKMRNWITDREDENKKNLLRWQFFVSATGIAISIVIGLLLSNISEPLGLSALILLGLSILVPLFFHSIPFSKESDIIAESTKLFERAVIETIDGMNAGMRWIDFDGPVLDDNLQITVATNEGTYSKIFMRSNDGKINFFFRNGTPVIPTHPA